MSFLASRTPFLCGRRLLEGPWQAFERDTARLLMHQGFRDVRIIGGTGDGGADVLGIKDGRLWIIQCKHTTTSGPRRDAIDEVIEAGRIYKADALAVATSRQPIGDTFRNVLNLYRQQGLDVKHLSPEDLMGIANVSPEYCSDRRALRDYQEDASTRFRQALLETGRGQLVLATGLGKTVVMAETVADLLRDNLIPHGRVLVLAHTRPLVTQLHRSFWAQLPKWVHTHQLGDRERPSYWDGITFATMQSALSGVAELPTFGLVLIDEAHHVGSTTFQQLLDSLRPPMLGGVTATPWRGDSFDIDTIFGPPQIQLGIADGLARGFLSDVDYRLLGDNIDWEMVQNASRHRYSLSQLNKKLIIPTRDETAAQIVAAQFNSEKRKSIVCFSPTILHARIFAQHLRSFGISSDVISSEEDAREREVRLSRFRAGDYQCLTTVDLFNEGVDVPDVDMLVFLRATHSRRIFVQQLGRGLRLSAGKKKVLVLDFVSDLRRMAEVIDLDSAIRGGDVESVGLGRQLVNFSDHSAGSFLREWILDQASLINREGDPHLEIPRFEYPEAPPPGAVQ